MIFTLKAATFSTCCVEQCPKIRHEVVLGDGDVQIHSISLKRNIQYYATTGLNETQNETTKKSHSRSHVA